MKKGELFRGVLSKQDAANVPENKPKRSEIFALAADDSVNVASVCAAAMAWGGMRVGHWKLLWDTSNGDWLKVAQCIRDGKPNRSEAYERLKTLKKKDQLKGMGPAFFTKLIYFLTPGTDRDGKAAYIMDRWTASSVNLLTGSNRVLLNGERTWKRPKDGLEVSYGFTVSDANTSDDYEAFCTAVDRLAADFCLCADQVDCALFSTVENRPGTWRRYVLTPGKDAALWIGPDAPQYRRHLRRSGERCARERVRTDYRRRAQCGRRGSKGGDIARVCARHLRRGTEPGARVPARTDRGRLARQPGRVQGSERDTGAVPRGASGSLPTAVSGTRSQGNPRTTPRWHSRLPGVS